MPDLHWNDLPLLLAIARGGNLARAAKRLRVDETTVARRLARAEAAFGLPLFLRSRGRLLPSEAGRLVLDQAARSELEIERLQAAVREQEASVAGSVRLTGVPLLVNRLLVPALPALFRAHPALVLELIAEPRDLSLAGREADIALRLARPQGEQRMLARRIGGLAYGVYGVRRRRATALPWIAYETAMATLPQSRWIARRVAAGEPLSPLRVNDAEALLQAAKRGIGRALLPCLVGEREPGLVRLDAGAPALTRDLWLLVHPDLRPLARVAAVMAWVEDMVAASA